MQLTIMTAAHTTMLLPVPPASGFSKKGPSTTNRPPVTMMAPMYCDHLYFVLRKTLVIAMLMGMAACDSRMTRPPLCRKFTARLCMTPAVLSRHPIMKNLYLGRAGGGAAV